MQAQELLTGDPAQPEERPASTGLARYSVRGGRCRYTASCKHIRGIDPPLEPAVQPEFHHPLQPIAMARKELDRAASSPCSIRRRSSTRSLGSLVMNSPIGRQLRRQCYCPQDFRNKTRSGGWGRGDEGGLVAAGRSSRFRLRTSLRARRFLSPIVKEGQRTVASGRRTTTALPAGLVRHAGRGPTVGRRRPSTRSTAANGPRNTLDSLGKREPQHSCPGAMEIWQQFGNNTGDVSPTRLQC